MVRVAKLADVVDVLHCFQKKIRQTAKRDIDLACKRLKELLKKIGKSPAHNDLRASGMPWKTRLRKPPA